MPLWKIHHPVGAYSLEDKNEFAEAITQVYEAVPIPRFYVVVIFEEVACLCALTHPDSYSERARATSSPIRARRGMAKFVRHATG